MTLQHSNATLPLHMTELLIEMASGSTHVHTCRNIPLVQIKRRRQFMGSLGVFQGKKGKKGQGVRWRGLTSAAKAHTCSYPQFSNSSHFLPLHKNKLAGVHPRWRTNDQVSYQDVSKNIFTFLLITCWLTDCCCAPLPPALQQRSCMAEVDGIRLLNSDSRKLRDLPCSLGTNAVRKIFGTESTR